MSAINNSKNRKKKNNKKKGKKQGGIDSATPSEISSPALTDNENLVQEESATASALPAAPIESTNSNLVQEESATASALPAAPISTTGSDNLIQKESATASALPAAPIEPDVDNVSTPTSKIPAGGPVGVGAAGAGATAAAVAIAAKKSISRASRSPPPAQAPLSDSVQSCIKTVVASGSLDILSIVKTVVKNVEAGDYKPKAALPTTAKAAVPTPPKDAASQPTTDKTSKSETVKKAAAGAGAAIAGAGAAVATAVKGDKNGKDKEVNSATNKLSENVQYCIQSVVQAPSVNVYGILEAANPNKVKCPEPAVGGTTQQNMPSSAKAADASAPPATLPPKVNEAHTKKGKENRKSGIAALKKKNCIIL